MKTLLILPLALLLISASCKKSEDTVTPQVCLPDNGIIKASDDLRGPVQVNALRLAGSRTNGDDVIGIDPKLHLNTDGPARIPSDGNLLNEALIIFRKDGDAPPRRPNTWEKAPGPISAY